MTKARVALGTAGWRSIFLVNVPIGMVALLAAAPLIHESRSHDGRSLDYGGVALLTSSLFLLIFPLVKLALFQQRTFMVGNLIALAFFSCNAV